MRDDGPHGNGFLEFLRRQGHGSLVDLLSAELAELGRGLDDYARAHGDEVKAKGSLTLTVSIERHKGVNTISSGVTAKHPKQPAVQSLMFTDKDGRFVSQDPAAPDIFEGPRELRGKTGA